MDPMDLMDLMDCDRGTATTPFEYFNRSSLAMREGTRKEIKIPSAPIIRYDNNNEKSHRGGIVVESWRNQKLY